MEESEYNCKGCGVKLNLSNDDILYGGTCPKCGHPFREELKIIGSEINVISILCPTDPVHPEKTISIPKTMIAFASGRIFMCTSSNPYLQTSRLFKVNPSLSRLSSTLSFYSFWDKKWGTMTWNDN